MRRNNTDDSNDSDGEEALPAPTTKIRLYLHCTNLTRSIIGPQPHSLCRVSLDPYASSKDETEIVFKSSNPTYTTSFQFDYEYGSQLLIYVDVYACKGKVTENSSPDLKLIGRECFDVQTILSTPTNTKAKPLPNLDGTIYAHIEQQFSTNQECLSLQLRAKSLVFTNSAMRKSLAAKTTLLGKPSTRFEISRPASSDSSRWIVVYRSAPIKESVTPTWDETLIDLNSICSDGEDPSAANVRISISMEKKKKWKEIGSFETTIQCLIDSCQTEEANRSSFELQPKAIRGRQSNEKKGEIMVVSAVLQQPERPGEARQRSQRILSGISNPLQEISSSTSKLFSDYVNAGLDIDLFVAIDFTSSNGDARIPGTLHYFKDGMSNDYMDAIESIGSEVEKYSKSKEFPVWGFGAKFPSDEISDATELPVHHIFQCGCAQPAAGTQGVLKAYRSVLREMNFYMSGPTEMIPVMKAALSRAKKTHNDPAIQLKYNVLLILTDGVVNDLNSTKSLILKYRHFPISFVVVGIGRADFTEMNGWNDQQPDLRGRFTFVEFRTLQFDPAALSGKALKRLPEDVVDYFSVK